MTRHVISIHLSDSCNLNCKHCYLGPPAKRLNSLSLPQIKSALSFYKQKGFDTVEFRGGEAYLYPYLRQAVNLAKKENYSSISVRTNGTYPQILKLFSPETIDHFTFGLAGATPKTNDDITSPGHFEKCLGSLIKALSLGFRVWVDTCLTAQNIKEIKDLISLLDSLGVSRLNFVFTSFIGNAVHYPKIIISPKQWLLTKNKIKKQTNPKNLVIHFPDFFVTKKEFRKSVKKDYRCLLRETEPKHADVFANGLVFSCSLLTESEEFASHLVTSRGVIPQNVWKTLLLERYPDSTCPAQQFLADKYKAIKLDEKITAVCPHL